MSIEAAKTFKGLVEQDAGLREEVLTAFQTGGPEAIVGLAGSKGYTFTPADAAAALAPSGEGEMSDLELEAIAGGKSKVGKQIEGFFAPEKKFFNDVGKAFQTYGKNINSYK